MSIIGRAIMANIKKVSSINGVDFLFTGKYTVKPASYYNLNGDYEVLALLSDGDLIFTSDINADIFMVGGGAGGIAQQFIGYITTNGTTERVNYGASRAAGGAGYNQLYSYIFPVGTIYNIIIGAGGTGYSGIGISNTSNTHGNDGENTQIFSDASMLFEANGGSCGTIDFDNYTCITGEGGSVVSAFKEESATAYCKIASGSGADNSGEGASASSGNGGSGIILIRLSQNTSE